MSTSLSKSDGTKVPRRVSLSRWIVRHRWILDLSVLMGAAVTTATLGFWIPESWPRATTGRGFEPDPGHTLLLVAAIAVLGALVYLRYRMRRAHGTLYYVRYLYGWMSDWHIEQERVKRRHHLDERVVSRQILATPSDGVWDLADEIDQLSRDLQMTMNEDDISSGFLVAPNLIWPASVALGFQLHPWPGLELEELEHPDKAMTFKLGAKSPPTEGFDRPFLFSDGITGETVLLTVELTATPVTMPEGFQPARRYRICVPLDPADQSIDSPGAAVLVTTDPHPTRRRFGAGTQTPDAQTRVHPSTAAAISAKAIATALSECPDATVYAILRIPKSVAVEVGHRISGLSTTDSRRQGGSSELVPHNPWQRLVLLLLDQDGERDRDDFLACRVHPSQPPAEVIAADAQRHRLALSRRGS